MATLQDIADRAGVSREMVSRILNRGAVSRRSDAQAREKRIRAIARQLGYQPNLAAQTVSTGRFNAAALITLAEQAAFISPKILFALHAELHAHDMNLSFARVSESELTGREAAPRLLRGTASDGLLIYEHTPLPDEAVGVLTGARIPAIWINSRRERDCVSIDDRAAAAQITRALLNLGHRRIWYIDDERRCPHYSQIERRDGYVATMEHAGLRAAARSVAIHSPTLDEEPGATRAIAALLCGVPASRRPTGLICYDMHGAAGAMVAAARLGLRIPDDLSIATFIAGAHAVGVRYGGVVVPEEEMARWAVDLLVRRIQTPSRHFDPVVLSMTFAPRQTVARAPRTIRRRKTR